MEAIFKSTEGDYSEAIIEINGFNFKVMDVFGGYNLKAGDTVDVEIEPGLYSDEQEWDDYFSGNPDKKREIVHLGGWKYHVLGMVYSINPVIVDAGICSY